MLVAVADAAPHDIALAVLRVSLPSMSFAGNVSSATLPAALEVGQHVVANVEETSGVAALSFAFPAEALEVSSELPDGFPVNRRQTRLARR